MPTYQQRVQAIPAAIRLPFLLFPWPLIALGAYWWWSYTGLYQWLAEQQIGLMHAYYPVYTGLFTLGLMGGLGLAPGLLLFHVLVKIDAFPVDPITAAPVRPYQVDAWLRAHRGLMTAFIITLTLLIGGGILLYAGLTVGPKRVVQLADLEAGQPPPSRRVEMEGVPCWNTMLTLENRKYVPFVSPRWQPGQPVAVFADVTRVPKAPAAGKPIRWEGTLTVTGLPGVLRDRFGGLGFLPGPSPQVLDVNDRPERTVEIGLAMVLLALAILGVTMVVWGLKLYWNRRTP